MKKMAILLLTCASGITLTACDSGPQATEVAKQHKGCNCKSGCNCASGDSQGGCGCVTSK